MRDAQYIYIRMDELADDLKATAAKCERLANSDLSNNLPNSRRRLRLTAEKIKKLAEDLR